MISIIAYTLFGLIAFAIFWAWVLDSWVGGKVKDLDEELKIHKRNIIHLEDEFNKMCKILNEPRNP